MKLMTCWDKGPEIETVSAHRGMKTNVSLTINATTDKQSRECCSRCALAVKSLHLSDPRNGCHYPQRQLSASMCVRYKKIQNIVNYFT